MQTANKDIGSVILYLIFRTNIWHGYASITIKESRMDISLESGAILYFPRY